MVKGKLLSRRSLYALFVGGLLIGLASVVTSGIWTLRQQANDMTCRGRMSQIALAIRNYKAENDKYPPLGIRGRDGKLPHSWRVLLLPQFGFGDYFAKYNMSEPWDSPKNLQWAKEAGNEIRNLYRSPNDSDGDENWTSFLAIAYSSDNDGELVFKINCDEHCCFPIVMVERHHSEIIWSEPVDITAEKVVGSLIKGNKGMTANFLTLDGRVGTLSQSSISFRMSEHEALPQLIPSKSNRKD